MIQSVYLHKYVVDTLCLFGDLSEVVNRILQEGADGNIELIDRPPCKNREGAGRYNITINQSDYIDMLQSYPYVGYCTGSLTSLSMMTLVGNLSTGTRTKNSNG